jgi:hypothetical protein
LQFAAVLETQMIKKATAYKQNCERKDTVLVGDLTAYEKRYLEQMWEQERVSQ